MNWHRLLSIMGAWESFLTAVHSAAPCCNLTALKMSDCNTGAAGRDRIISLCCVTVSIILISIHSGPLGVSLPATQQTTPFPTNNKWTRDLPPVPKHKTLTASTLHGESTPLQVRRSNPWRSYTDRLKAIPVRVIAARVIGRLCLWLFDLDN